MTSKTADPTIDIPKRHLPWFTQLLLAFAAIVLAAIVYAFWHMGKAPMPTLDVPSTENPAPAPGRPAAP